MRKIRSGNEHAATGAQSLLRADVIGDLVGVIDLKEGVAVHAVAGQREDYRPVAFGTIAGDPASLANHYLSLGIRRLYIADLDGLAGRQIQTSVLERLIDSTEKWDELLLDLGCSDAALAWFHGLHPRQRNSPMSSRMILATEALPSIEKLGEIANSIQGERLLIGIDYRDGVLLSRSGDEATWLDTARRAEISAAVVLDVASVGTGNSDAAAERCQRIHSIDPAMQLYSGGGISRFEDVLALRKAGCQRYLVATVLHQRRSTGC